VGRIFKISCFNGFMAGYGTEALSPGSLQLVSLACLFIHAKDPGDTTGCRPMVSLTQVKSCTLAEPLMVNCAPNLRVHNVEMRSARLRDLSSFWQLISIFVQKARPYHPE